MAVPSHRRHKAAPTRPSRCRSAISAAWAGAFATPRAASAAAALGGARVSWGDARPGDGSDDVNSGAEQGRARRRTVAGGKAPDAITHPSREGRHERTASGTRHLNRTAGTQRPPRAPGVESYRRTLSRRPMHPPALRGAGGAHAPRGRGRRGRRRFDVRGAERARQPAGAPSRPPGGGAGGARGRVRGARGEAGGGAAGRAQGGRRVRAAGSRVPGRAAGADAGGRGGGGARDAGEAARAAPGAWRRARRDRGRRGGGASAGRARRTRARPWRRGTWRT